MSTVSQPHAYDSVPGHGVIYDAVPVYASRADVAFYTEEAVRSKGPVLELGCGTGRILLPIARAGCTAVGVDGSQELLHQFAAKLASEPEDVRERVTLHRADARDVDLQAAFPLVIAPFRVFQLQSTMEDQRRFVAAAARHVAPGGRFVFDVFNPHFARMVAVDGAEQEDTPETALPDGRRFRRAARVLRVRWLEQVSEVELIYYVAAHLNAAPERYVHAFEMRWFLPAELTHLLERGGFHVDAIYGDFARGALIEASPDLVVCATRA